MKKKTRTVLLVMAMFGVAGDLVSACGQANAGSDQQSADQFAQEAFEKFRARELRELPLSSQYDDTKIRNAEATAGLIPTEKPSSSRLTQVQILGNHALVRHQYVYPNRTLEVSVGMERGGAAGEWKLYGLSVTPAAETR